MKVFVGLALLLPAFAVAAEVQLERRDGGEMAISENHQCYVWGQCQEYSLDFSQQEDAEGCHSFCGKVDRCNWWSWKPAQSLCLVFENCTETGGPSGVICPDCISGESVCPAQDCHQAKKCEGHFVDSFTMSLVEDCIDACDEEDACKWYTLEKQHDHCILYEDCDFHDDSCDTCATGPKYCSRGYHGTTPAPSSGGLDSCYTEEDTEYKIHRKTKNKEGLTNLNLNGDKWSPDKQLTTDNLYCLTCTAATQKAYAEECRTFCRDNYAEAKYFSFTMHGGPVTRNMCYCKRDHNLEETRYYLKNSKRISGNVQCRDYN